MLKPQKRKFDMAPENLQSLDHETLIGMIMRLYEQNSQLSEQLRLIVAEKHGPKTERFVDTNQLRLFGGEQSTEEAALPAKEEAGEAGQVPRKPVKSKGHRRNPMPSWLKRVPIRGAAPEAQALQCQCCGTARLKQCEVITNSRLEFKPAEFFVEDFIDAVYACPECGDTLVVHPDEPEIIENGGAGAGLLTEVSVSKYEDHCPLYRQEQRFARLGLSISRSTMCGWLAATVSIVRPLYNYMRSLLLLSKVIATDDTPIKVLDRKHKRNIKTGRFWIFRGDDGHPFNLFDYTPGRARAGPMSFLKGWKGYLQGDCFSGNQALCAESGSTHVACMAHARRYFIKAQSNNKKACAEILSMFQQLFKIESDARAWELPAAEVKLLREQEAKPILAEMKKWLDGQSLVVLRQSNFGQAVNYCLNNWDELTNYLHDGDLRLDNNLAEQEMKRVAIGRKNFLFLGSDNGGEQAEVLMSIMSTCRRHSVEPWNYLCDVIQKLSKNPNTDLNELLPHRWKPTANLAKINRSPLSQTMAS